MPDVGTTKDENMDLEINLRPESFEEDRELAKARKSLFRL